MAKRNFAALVGVVMVVWLGGNAQAQRIPVNVDGCTVLARAVFEEVSVAALHGPGKSGPWLINPQPADIFICRTTARTVSKAFTSAMSSAGFEVDWGDYPNPGGDYCFSGFLSQCYPEGDRGFTGANKADTAFVQKSWAVVSHSVLREMANPFSSDEVRFRSDDLKLKIGLSLRSINAMNSRNSQ